MGQSLNFWIQTLAVGLQGPLICAPNYLASGLKACWFHNNQLGNGPDSIFTGLEPDLFSPPVLLCDHIWSPLFTFGPTFSTASWLQFVELGGIQKPLDSIYFWNFWPLPLENRVVSGCPLIRYLMKNTLYRGLHYIPWFVLMSVKSLLTETAGSKRLCVVVRR